MTEDELDDELEKVIGPLMDLYHSEFQSKAIKHLAQFDNEILERVKQRWDKSGTDITEARVISEQIGWALFGRLIGAKMDAVGSSMWCLHHDCDGAECPKGSHG